MAGRLSTGAPTPNPLPMRSNMTNRQEKVIITCAVTGSVHTPTMSEHLPLTPAQIAEQAIEAAEAGAAILHLHARDPRDGRPRPTPLCSTNSSRASATRPT